jgi:hypothetical protein
LEVDSCSLWVSADNTAGQEAERMLEDAIRAVLDLRPGLSTSLSVVVMSHEQTAMLFFLSMIWKGVLA